MRWTAEQLQSWRDPDDILEALIRLKPDQHLSRISVSRFGRIGVDMSYRIAVALWCGLALSGCRRATDGSTARQQAAEHEAAPSATRAAIHPWCDGRPDIDLVLTPDSLGPINRRTTRAQLRTVCPASRDTVLFDAEGNGVPATVLRFGRNDVGFAEWLTDGRLDRVRIVSRRVRTGRELRVGSSLRDIRQVLGAVKAGYDDGGVFVWTDTDPFVSYLLAVDASAILPSPDDVSTRPDALPDSATIKALVFVPRD